MNSASFAQIGHSSTTLDRTAALRVATRSVLPAPTGWSVSLGDGPTRRVAQDIDRGFKEGLRAAAVRWLDEWAGAGYGILSLDQLAWLTPYGRRVPFMDPKRGVQEPASTMAALSIRTRFASSGRVLPCEDFDGPDELSHCEYRGLDPHRLESDHPENVALRRVFERGMPSMSPCIRLELSGTRATDLGSNDRIVSGPIAHIRSRVLTVYANSCAICRLQHTSLLGVAIPFPWASEGHGGDRERTLALQDLPCCLRRELDQYSGRSRRRRGVECRRPDRWSHVVPRLARNGLRRAHPASELESERLEERYLEFC